MLKILQSLKRLARQKTKIVISLIVGLVVGASGSAFVFATIPDANGKINACYSTGVLGRVRIIDAPSQSCNANETAISWDQSAGPGKFVANLVGQDFTQASLQARNFAGIDMHNSNFTSSNLNGSDLSGANLSGSDLGAVRAKNANFQNANLSSSTFNPSTLEFQGSNFNGVNFSGATFDGQNHRFDGATLQNANFTNATFGLVPASSTIAGGDFTGSTFTGATFRANNTFSGSNLSGIDFSGSTFREGTSLEEVDLSGANFSNLTLSITLFLATVTGSTNFTNVQFVNANLSQTDMSNSMLTGATWSNTICPDGTNSDDNGNTCIGHLVT